MLVGVLAGALLRAKLQKLEKVPVSETEKGRGVSIGIFVYAWAQVAEIFK